MLSISILNIIILFCFFYGWGNQNIFFIDVGSNIAVIKFIVDKSSAKVQFFFDFTKSRIQKR